MVHQAEVSLVKDAGQCSFSELQHSWIVISSSLSPSLEGQARSVIDAEPHGHEIEALQGYFKCSFDQCGLAHLGFHV